MNSEKSLNRQVRRIRNHLISAAGSSDVRDRRAIEQAVESGMLGDAVPEVPNPALQQLTSAMVDDPAKSDIGALRLAGFSDDAIFELVLTAATAAGHALLEQAVRALDETKE